MSDTWTIGELSAAPRLLPQWIVQTGPITLPAPVSALRSSRGGMAEIRTSQGFMALLDADGRPKHDLYLLQQQIATESSYPMARRRYPTRVPLLVRRKVARFEHELRRLRGVRCRPAFAPAGDAVGALARHADQLVERTPWPDDKRSAFVVTHDVEAECPDRVVQLARSEAELGIRATYFLIPSQWRDQALPEQLRELGHEVACHGLDHSGREANAPLADFDAVIRKLGLGPPLGYRSPHFACPDAHAMRVGALFAYDSSRPDTRWRGRRIGWLGCETIFPFVEHNNTIQLPVTLPTDLDLLDDGYDWSKVRLAWRVKWRWISDARGLGLLCTHIPAPGGETEVLPFLTELVGDDQAWIGTAGELAEFLTAKARPDGTLRPWAELAPVPVVRHQLSLTPLSG
ncbi:polysaccharide deacetylase family protein [Tenggerimyces flavus]|uniref:Polysaccharide deacetylase n=1 Tax=Tenggerimyces flavus TaxID=1708749 RepID=A0ABV7YK21_9ACTN|nr:hypothetical protein [Tenggerimyces flavus]MBM7789577.1 peptidoglycan/xylan/chitin deacetylase (PgdA/CDA1 family) [Tenggerimyces flavus]